MEIQVHSHQIAARKNILKAWKEELYCDVTVTCGSKSLKAHKLILSSISDYFKCLFKYGSNQDVYVLDESVCTENCLDGILHYAYTGEVNLDINTVLDMLIAADYLQIDLVTHECEVFILKNIFNIEINDIIHLVPFANKLELTLLADPICNRISENFFDILKNSEFFLLTPSDLIFLLKNNNLSAFDHCIPLINPEIEILKLVGVYLSNHRPICSPSVVSDLLEEIRFEEFQDPDELKSVVKWFPILDCPKLQEIICIKEIISLSTEDIVRAVVSMPEQRRRKFSKYNKQLTLSGTQFSFQNGKEDEVFSGNKDSTDRPAKFTLWVRERPSSTNIVAGISIRYFSGSCFSYGKIPKRRSSYISEHSFTLDRNEVITTVVLRTSSIVDRITFITNYGREYGPFGGTGGNDNIELPPGERGYFQSFSGNLASTNRVAGLSCLVCRWICFSDVELPKHSENVVS